MLQNLEGPAHLERKKIYGKTKQEQTQVFPQLIMTVEKK